jgi:hypothetical protein
VNVSCSLSDFRAGLILDLDLDVEEEDHERGIEPPAHWPSRESTVQVENLTCHYAPQVCFSRLIFVQSTDF